MYKYTRKEIGHNHISISKPACLINVKTKIASINVFLFSENQLFFAFFPILVVDQNGATIL